MDDVLGPESRDDRTPDREVELVQGDDVVGGPELPVGPRVADVPGELLPRDLDLHRVLRHPLLDLLPAAPGEERDHDADDGRDDRPNDFHAVVAVGVERATVLPESVAEEEEEKKALDDHEDDAGDPEDQVEQPVHPPAVARDPFGQFQPERQRPGERRKRRENQDEERRPEGAAAEHRGQPATPYPLKAKSTVFVSEPETVTFCVCAPYFSCQASIT